MTLENMEVVFLVKNFLKRFFVLCILALLSQIKLGGFWATVCFVIVYSIINVLLYYGYISLVMKGCYSESAMDMILHIKDSSEVKERIILAVSTLISPLAFAIANLLCSGTQVNGGFIFWIFIWIVLMFDK